MLNVIVVRRRRSDLRIYGVERRSRVAALAELVFRCQDPGVSVGFLDE